MRYNHGLHMFCGTHSTPSQRGLVQGPDTCSAISEVPRVWANSGEAIITTMWRSRLSRGVASQALARATALAEQYSIRPLPRHLRSTNGATSLQARTHRKAVQADGASMAAASTTINSNVCEQCTRPASMGLSWRESIIYIYDIKAT